MGHATKNGFVNAVTVRIWYPNPNEASWHERMLSPKLGHASLTVKLNSVRHYITWQVADGTPNLVGQQEAHNYQTHGNYEPEGQMKKTQDESWMSGMKWGQMNGENLKRYDGWKRSQCNWKFRIKTKQPNDTEAGLNAQDIITWWEQRVASENVYKLISTNQNCTGCVAEALKAGGMQGSPSGDYLVGAADLRSWVEFQVVQQNLQLDQAKAGYD